MSQFNELPTKLETALVAVVNAVGLVGVAVSGGMSSATLSRPSVVCHVSDSAVEEIKDTAIFRFKAGIIVRSSPDDGLDITVAKARVGQIADAFLDSSIAATLSAAVSDFYVYDVSYSGWQHGTDERDWSTTLEIEVLCCGTDIG